MTTFLWADCHTHGPHKSTYLDSYSAVRLVDKDNAIWACRVVTFFWVNYHTPMFSHLHYPHQVSDAVHNLAKQ